MEDIPLEPFIQGSRNDLEVVARKFCEEYNSDAGAAFAKEWENFRDHVAPQSDSVEEWNEVNPVHIPFRDTLLRGDPVRVRPLSNVEAEEHYGASRQKEGLRVDRPRKSVPLDYVNWSRWGETKPSSDPSTLIPNVVVEGSLGIERFSVPVTCKSSKVPVSASLVPSSGVRLPPLKVVTAPTVDLSSSSSSASVNIPSGDVSGSVDDTQEDNLEDEDTDSDIEDDRGWVTCRGVHNIPRYYCARDCVGNTFTVPHNLLQKAFFADKCPVGKIHSIVRKRGADANDVFFKFYNHEEYPEEPPPDDSDAYCFIKCTDFMSSSTAVRMMNWDSKYRERAKPKKPRKKRSHWAMEPTRPALFDEDSHVDIHGARKLRSGKRIATEAPPVTESDQEQLMREDVPVVQTETNAAAPVSTRSSSRTLPPLNIPDHVTHRHRLRYEINRKLVARGLKPAEEDVLLSDMSCSDESSSDSDDSS